MSKQKPRTRTTGTIPVRHELQHEVPTIIHDPEVDMTALGRVVKHLLEKPASFWWTVLGGTAVVLLAIGIWSSTTGARVVGSEAWTKLGQSKDPSEMVAIAKDFPGSPAAEWALLQAGANYFNRGLDDLPKNRDAAEPMLKKAQDAYEEVVKTAAKDSQQARVGMMGKARTLEARNHLSEAIEAYELLAKTWPGTPEAIEAKAFAEALKKPEAVAFYKELYSYVEPRATLPPPGASGMPTGIMELAPGASSPLGGSFPLPPGMDLKPGATMKVPVGPKVPSVVETPVSLPDAVVKPKASTAPATPKPATPKPAAPAEKKPAAATAPAAKPADTKPAAATAPATKPADTKPAAAAAPAKPAETKPGRCSRPGQTLIHLHRTRA